MVITDAPLFQDILMHIKDLKPETISEDRKIVLKPLIQFVQDKVSRGDTVRLNFICTHNSRRSHLSQIWAQTMAHYFKLEKVCCYSGGTESTALFPMIASTLEKVGFQITKISEDKNPVYAVKYSDNVHPVVCFSKTIDHTFNPKSQFAAIMTCDAANEACPFVSGAEVRIPITFEDPKAYDNTPQQVEKYKERSLQIATELFHVFSQIDPRKNG